MGNLISLFEQQPMKREDDSVTGKHLDEMFQEAIKKNAENKRKLQEDRLKANKSVLKAYRIKT